MGMAVHYSPTLVVLSVLVAIFASYVALNLAHSVSEARGRARVLWLGCGAIAMGVGIWSMHFVGMLAFEMPGMSMAYDVPLMILSVVVAIGASLLALIIVSRPIVPMTSLVSGGVSMAAAIAGMHYIGMYSMRMAATIRWNIYLVVLSIAIALVASFGALLISIKLRDKSDHLIKLSIAAVVMGIAIVGMHYTGMSAATFIHNPANAIKDENLLVTSGLAVAVVAMTLLILGLALAGSVGQRLWTQGRRRTEEVLTKNEERFRALIEAIKDYAIFMLDPDGFVTSWNLGAERITGYAAVEAIGEHVSRFYTPEDIDRSTAEKELSEARATGHFEAEALRVRRDGSTFWANVVITPLYEADGQLLGFSKVTRDITQLREADLRMRKLNEELEKRVEKRTRELQMRESQLRMITNALPVLVGQLDPKEKFLFVNDALAGWFDRTYEQMVGATFGEVLGETRYPANEPFIRRALAGEVVSYERYSNSKHHEGVLNITFVPEKDSSGLVTGLVLVASDVTKYKQIEAELKNAKDAAEVASEAKSAFLANMSHEIRTPLGVILGYSELLMAQEMSRSEKVNSVEAIKRNGRLLSNIINDILDLSKVEAGKLSVDKIEVPFAEVLNEISSLLNLEATAKGIELTVTSEGVLPSFVNTDPLRLRQILLNIIGNAIKFTDRGSVDVRVRLMLGADSSSTKLAFIVKDTGEGISPEQASKLFTPFTQADPSTTRKFGGTGLGLVLAKKLANALGGDVMLAESVHGKGSTFVVTIDPGDSKQVLFRNSEQELSQKTVQFSAADLSTDLHEMKVLVVDDSLDNQFLVKRLLRLAGAKVDVANNGREAVKKALDGEFDLILMDIQMPEMDGYEATKELRANGFEKPIIALTAHAMKEERRRCLDQGFTDHLTKPIERQSLLRALSEYTA